MAKLGRVLKNRLSDAASAAKTAIKKERPPLMADYANKLYDMQQKGQRLPGTHWVKPTWDNALTGIKVNKSLDIGIGAGIAGVTAASIAMIPRETEPRKDTVAKGVDVGSISQIGYQKALAEGRQGGARGNMGATGDIVFGLHNSRRGGR